jgi:hypothetical protein
MAADTNTIRIGLPYDGTYGPNQTFIAGISGTPITGGLPVVGTPALLSSTVVQLKQQAQDQQATIADVRAMIADQGARLARLEALVGSSAGVATKPQDTLPHIRCLMSTGLTADRHRQSTANVGLRRCERLSIDCETAGASAFIGRQSADSLNAIKRDQGSEATSVRLGPPELRQDGSRIVPVRVRDPSPHQSGHTGTATLSPSFAG